MGTTVFLDILNANFELKVYDLLREEAAQAFQSETDWSNPKTLHKLVLADSVIRERLRPSSVIGRGLMRQVVPKDGIVLPDSKRVARGTRSGSHVQAIHMGDRFYDRPDQYDPFRFARSASEKDRLDATQTSDTFLRWGHGRSAWSVLCIPPKIRLRAFC